MPKQAEEKTPPRRTQIKELPKKEKRLSKSEQKKIKGGETLARKGSSKQESQLSSL